jgi:hypothetical protein
MILCERSLLIALAFGVQVLAFGPITRAQAQPEDAVVAAAQERSTGAHPVGKHPPRPALTPEQQKIADAVKASLSSEFAAKADIKALDKKIEDKFDAILAKLGSGQASPPNGRIPCYQCGRPARDVACCAPTIYECSAPVYVYPALDQELRCSSTCGVTYVPRCRTRLLRCN